MSGSSERSAARSFSRRINIRLFALTLMILAGAAAFASWRALDAFERELVPEVEQKSVTVGQSVNDLIERALQLGVPFGRLVGMENFLRDAKAPHPEIRYIAVSSTEGGILYQSVSSAGELPNGLDVLARKAADSRENSWDDVPGYQNTAMPILHEGDVVGVLHIGVDRAFVRQTISEILYDILVVLLISLLVTFEVLLIIVALSITTPIRLMDNVADRLRKGDFSLAVQHRSNDEIGRFLQAFNATIRSINNSYDAMLTRVREVQKSVGNRVVQLEMEETLERIQNRFRFFSSEGPRQRLREISLINIRTPLFIFIFAEELSRSFFPIYVKELYAPIPGLTPEMVIGLPISVFMLMVAIATPFAGSWADRFGPRRVFMIGLVPAVVGFIGTGLAVSLYDLLFWRCLCAFGYATIYIACQGYIADNTDSSNRAQGMAIFMGGVFAAGICGAAIGGILADRIGFRLTFFVSTALALLAGVLVVNLLDPQAPRQTRAAKRGLRIGDFFTLLGNPRFLTLILFGAIPGKIILTGFLFYLAPLYLKLLGDNQSTIGRVLMAYGIVTIIATPVFARAADRWKAHRWFVGVGTAISGLGLISILYQQSTLTVLAGVIMLGLGHAMSISPQLAMVPSICAKEVAEIGQTTVLSVFRLIERMGSVIGPFIVAALIGAFGSSGAMAGTGILIAGAGVLFLAIFLGFSALGKSGETD
jgi:predicted MFS family arabinose efflux permease/HAMP domain-containing protein